MMTGSSLIVCSTLTDKVLGYPCVLQTANMALLYGTRDTAGYFVITCNVFSCSYSFDCLVKHGILIIMCFSRQVTRAKSKAVLWLNIKGCLWF